MTTPNDFAANIARFTGFADAYDQFRPHPPTALLDYLTRLLVKNPSQTVGFVVDLGSGTGLSTRAWATRAEKIVGIEPTTDMRRQAESTPTPPHITYQGGFSHDTGLPSQSVDVITCSQSLHWMEPSGTFTEAARILRPGGIFCAYDNDWPPATASWEAEAAFTECMERARHLEKTHGFDSQLINYAKTEHLERMQASGKFRYCWEVVLHNLEMGSAERLVGLVLSQGRVMTPLKNGFSESEMGLDNLREVASRTLLPDAPFMFCYRVRLGVV